MTLKNLALLIALLSSSPSIAADSLRWALGQGVLYGGALGARATYDLEMLRLSAAAGLLAYSSATGLHAGYGIGAEIPFAQKHSLGLHLGTKGVAFRSSLLSPSSVLYRGAELTYNYYFSGINNRSWHLGGGYYYAEPKNKPRGFASSHSGLAIVGGYQF